MIALDPLVSPVLVGIGGVLGAIARHRLGERIETGLVDTFLVNVLGSFALGVLLAIPIGDSLALLFATGFCGAFTTFSTVAVETVRLAETGDATRAVGNALLTLGGAIAAIVTGSALPGMVPLVP